MRSFCGQRRVCSAPRGSPQTARQRNTAEVFASDLRVFGGELRRANRSCSGSAVVSARLRGWSWQSAALRATSFHQQNMRQAKSRVNIIFLRKTRTRKLSISQKREVFSEKIGKESKSSQGRIIQKACFDRGVVGHDLRYVARVWWMCVVVSRVLGVHKTSAAVKEEVVLMKNSVRNGILSVESCR